MVESLAVAKGVRTLDAMNGRTYALNKNVGLHNIPNFSGIIGLRNKVVLAFGV